MIQRDAGDLLKYRMSIFPAVGLLGPRQIGKTTLALEIARQLNTDTIYLDLENASDLSRLYEPELYFNDHSTQTFILDEIQRVPDLFASLRGIIDSRIRAGQKSGQFLMLGSASLDLLKQSSESLAGRISYVRLSGLKITEIEVTQQNTLWLRGGFPSSFLADDNGSSFLWRQEFITTYLERDVPQFGSRVPSATLRTFWIMLAHVQGGLLNLSSLSSSLSISVPTLGRYIDLLDELFLVRKLHPWSANIGKRLVKSPKVYIRDSGIAHALLKIDSYEDLLTHPSMGGSWEGFVIENLIADLPLHASASFYRTSAGAEVDLVIEGAHNVRIAVEIKRSLKPVISRGFQLACQDMQASHKFIVYAGQDSYRLSRDVRVCSLRDMILELRKLLA